MKNAFCVFAVSAVLLLTAAESRAGAPTCHAHPGGNFCSYTGTVEKLYVNIANQIIFNFDTPMDPSAPTSVGISGVQYHTAAIFRLADNMEFGKLLYASLLSAQARDTVIQVQMRGTYGGYLIVDRIWLLE